MIGENSTYYQKSLAQSRKICRDASILIVDLLAAKEALRKTLNDFGAEIMCKREFAAGIKSDEKMLFDLLRISIDVGERSLIAERDVVISEDKKKHIGQRVMAEISGISTTWVSKYIYCDRHLADECRTLVLLCHKLSQHSNQIGNPFNDFDRQAL